MDSYLQECVTQFRTLLDRSSALIHHIDDIDWKTITAESIAAETASTSNVITSISSGEESSEDDDDLFGMLGGYESEEDRDTIIADDLVNEEMEHDRDEEDEATLMKRASAVHSALLLSISTLGSVISEDGKSLVFYLVDAVIQTTSGANTGMKTSLSDADSFHELVRIIAYSLRSSAPPKSFRRGSECWEKVCSTNSLLAVQFLLHLLILSEPSSNALKGWTDVILPLLMGNETTDGTYVSLLMKHDSLREALLSLTPSSLAVLIPASSSVKTLEQITLTCNLCLRSIHEATSSPEVSARQTKINVVCQVLLRLYNDAHKLAKFSRAETNLKTPVRSALHRAVLLILHGICYDSILKIDNQGNFKVQAPLLSVEAIRTIGTVLPKLYPSSDESKIGTKVERGNHPVVSADDDNLVELWSEFLLLLSPYSTELLKLDPNGNYSGGTRRRCQRWSYVAPLSATAVLCLLLPTIVDLEMPTIVRNEDFSSTAKWEVDQEISCRPAVQAIIWKLIRECLGRCGDAPISRAFRSGEGGDASGRGTSLLSREKKTVSAADDGSDWDPSHQDSLDHLLRRRSIHAMRILVEGENGRRSIESARKREARVSSDDAKLVEIWMKYVLVFEMLEMEIELHLVDQIWPAMKELASQVLATSHDHGNNGSESDNEVLCHLPHVIWEDIASILKRVLLSEAPTLRKLGLYRFLRGDSGIEIAVPTLDSLIDDDVEGASDHPNVFMNKPKSKYKIKKRTGDLRVVNTTPLSVVTPSFVLDVVMVSYDSIIGTKVGTNMQIDEGGQLKSESIIPLLSDFLSNYAITLATVNKDDLQQLNEYVNGVFGSHLVKSCKSRSLVTFFQAVATALESISASSLSKPMLDPLNINETVRSLVAQFSSGGAPKTLQAELLKYLVISLAESVPWPNPDVALVLRVIALYPPEELLDNNSSEESLVQQTPRMALTSWILELGNSTWATTAASTYASAFVIGELFAFTDFDFMSGINATERETGMALCTLSSLAGRSTELMSAVSQGLQMTPPIDSGSTSFCMANRSMILLEFGCKVGAFGAGNGDRIFKQCQRPINTEAILQNAYHFVLSQLTNLSFALSEEIGKHGQRSTLSGANRSSEANNVTAYISTLIGQLSILRHSFPSSVSISCSANNTLQKTVESMSSSNPNVVKMLMLLYAALSSGASFSADRSRTQITLTCQKILDVDLSSIDGLAMRRDSKQALRSMFHYAKWGCLSKIIPMLKNDHQTASNTYLSNELTPSQLSKRIIDVAKNSVEATPVVALPSLFKSIVSACDHIVVFHSENSLVGQRDDPPLLSSLRNTIIVLFAILEEEVSSSTWFNMLNEICKLIFTPRILQEEYTTSYLNDDHDSMPVLNAFEKMLNIGGTSRPHICKAVVSVISSAWLGEIDSKDDVGTLAIPYRGHIVKLLIYKEGKIDENALSQADNNENTNGILPENTNSSSIIRAFVLVFLSRLPSVDAMSMTVLRELVFYVMDELLDICCAKPDPSKPFITGSEEYARASRAWQAMCLLSRFLTKEKAEDIVDRVYQAMTNNSHGPVRYFIEVFTIQCTRKHPEVFGSRYIREINRPDLSLQYLSSLMVVGGNTIAGKYSSPFFQSSNKQKIKDVLCGVLPWLSSTQGFSRAIAQLLVYKLIPLVVDITPGNPNPEVEVSIKDDAVFLSLYSFLETNGEMARLRAKQENFFDSYDIDDACSLEGLLSIPVDEGEEANPKHLVEAIKECLVEVYNELHEEDAPLWKQIGELSIETGELYPNSTTDTKNGNSPHNDTGLVNFQRKILPIDALDLTILSYRNQKIFNAAGKKKQTLIICATLVDKIPNLAGLARTAEIFSAQLLVIPNLSVRKQDDFKTISASASDWIEMEECKEEELLGWLEKKKSQGYAIVGLEQTSSSMCITKYRFPVKTVLLLGKEKEGIPVSFLSAVDQCIEIPQQGIIRSLNVHVSGAIAIWQWSCQHSFSTTKERT